MRTVSLVNKRRAMLPPILVPELGHLDHIVGVNERNMMTGEVGRRKVTQSLPQAITLCARGTEGDRVDGLPEAAASSPDVLAAKARGDIDVFFTAMTVEASPLATTAPPPASPAASSDSPHVEVHELDHEHEEHS